MKINSFIRYQTPGKKGLLSSRKEKKNIKTTLLHSRELAHLYELREFLGQQSRSPAVYKAKRWMELGHLKPKMTRVHRAKFNRENNYRERTRESWRKQLCGSLLNGDHRLRKEITQSPETYNLPTVKETAPSSDSQEDLSLSPTGGNFYTLTSSVTVFLTLLPYSKAKLAQG